MLLGNQSTKRIDRLLLIATGIFGDQLDGAYPLDAARGVDLLGGQLYALVRLSAEFRIRPREHLHYANLHLRGAG